MVMRTLRGIVVLLTSCSWNVFILTVNWTHLTCRNIWKLSILNIPIFNCEWALTDYHKGWSSLHHSFIWDDINILTVFLQTQNICSCTLIKCLMLHFWFKLITYIINWLKAKNQSFVQNIVQMCMLKKEGCNIMYHSWSLHISGQADAREEDNITTPLNSTLSLYWRVVKQELQNLESRKFFILKLMIWLWEH